MRLFTIIIIFFSLAGGFLSGCNDQEQQTVIKLQPEQQTKLDYLPRNLLFQTPVQYQGRISPNGAKVSWLSLVDGALHLFVADSDNPQSARQFTFGENGVEIHEWSPNSAFVIYTISNTKLKSLQTFSLNVLSAESISLGQLGEGISVKLLKISRNWPDIALVSINDPNQQKTGLYRINLRDGTKKLVRKNSGFNRWVVDDDLQARIAIKKNPDLSQDWYLSFDNGQQRKLLHVQAKDVAGTRPLRIDPSGTVLYLLDQRGRQHSVFSQINLVENSITVIGKVKNYSINSVLFHPVSGQPMAWWYNASVPQWVSEDQQFQITLQTARQALGPNFFVLATTSDMQRLVIYSSRPDRPGKYSLLNRKTNTISTMFETAPAGLILQQSQTKVVEITTRDQFKLIGYFSPSKVYVNQQPVSAPLIILPQQSPGSRKYYSYDPVVQWLNSRGFSVLELNTRGAGRLGIGYDRYQNNGFLEKPSSDLIDAASWAVEQGWTQSDQIAIIGTSFAGFSVLQAANSSDNPFKCVVVFNPIIDIPSKLSSLQNSQTELAYFFSKLLSNEINLSPKEARQKLSLRQPSEKISAPILMIQTKKTSDAELSIVKQYAQTLYKLGSPITLVISNDEKERQEKYNAVPPTVTISEQFFAKCLGGIAEPVGDDLLGYDIKIDVGSEHFTELSAILNRTKSP
ncbi:MAG: prolyl oligopeptidase family serine peptidase [Robiginitomaculum sp.]|nr:prolyl oligopeptidase family serine peptidase [Robiginitomaculum sp.]